MSEYASTNRQPLALRAIGLSKTFGSIRVLESAGMAIPAGTVHALVGANGAGKSVLVRCITGVHQADPGGVIEVDGVFAPRHHTPKSANALGIRVVHQEAPVIDHLTVAELEGLYRGFPKIAGVGINWRKLRKRTSENLERLGVAISPRQLGQKLSAGDRAMVMLAFVLADMDAGARLIVLDEPTASLPVKDADRFLEAVRTAASHGVGILLVTHRLAEIFQTAQTLTVLRDGEVVLDAPVAGLTHDQLVREIVGARDERARPARVRRSERFAPRLATDVGVPQPDALEVRNLGGALLGDVSFVIKPGEILGVTGIGGSGAEELGGLIAGAIKPRRGEVIVSGTKLSYDAGTRQSIAAGIGYVPADRMREGGIGALDAGENVALPNFDGYWGRKERERSDVAEVIATFGVRPPEASRAFRTFSGGNQQKLIVGKWALTRPKVFVLDDPTSGVDPGAREDLFAVIRGLTESGTAVLFISTEPEQLARVAQRVLVLHDGGIAAELAGADMTEEAISAASII